MLKYKLINLYFLFSIPLCAQIEQAGTPLMNHKDFIASEVIYALPNPDTLFIEAKKSRNTTGASKTLQFAIERPVDISPEHNGAWSYANGMHVWRAHLISANAYSLGMYCSRYELKDNAKLFIYTPDGKEIKGAFTKENNKDFGGLMIGHIPGDELIVELQVIGNRTSYGQLRIESLSHAFLPVFATKTTKGTGLGTAQACEIDISCEEGEDWQILKRSVVHIHTGTDLCSGTLINNTSYNGTPYILTAEHCINREYSANRSVYYFNFENSHCDSLNAKKNQSVSGSALKATGYHGDAKYTTPCLDFSLTKLSLRPPGDYNVYYAGWDAHDRQHNGSVTLHHPNGDAKKISYDYDVTDTPSEMEIRSIEDDYIAASNIWIKEWDLGTTEGGSSGSPLFNLSKRVIGSLSFGLAVCGPYTGDDPETGDPIYSLQGNVNDFYSAIHFNWDHYSDTDRQLKHWLDPLNSGVLSLGGLNSKMVDIKTHHASQIQLYPNPATTHVTIVVPEQFIDHGSVEILSLSGQVLKNISEIYEFPYNCDIQDIKPGTYLLKLYSEQLTASTLLIVQ